MCVVSMVGDHYADKWRDKPWVSPRQPFRVYPDGWPWADEGTRIENPISRQEFDALRKEVEEMKELLKRAVKYDEDNDEPHCEVEDKMDLLRRVAAAVGVDLDDVIGPKGVA